MRKSKAPAFGFLVLWLLIPSETFAHGGPPTTRNILFGSGYTSLVTTHGFFAEDGNWAWICEEAAGTEVTSNATRTPTRWWVGSIDGLRSTTDTCNWKKDSALEDKNIIALSQDISDPELVWAATEEGIWRVDGESPSLLEKPYDFSLRHFAQGIDGSFMAVGFEGADPIAELDGEKIPLPIETGRMQVLSGDAKGRFYIRFPAGATDKLLRVSKEKVEVLIPSTGLIRDVVRIDEDLYALFRDGISRSEDDGLTWAPQTGRPIRCLKERPEGFYACPGFLSPEALLYAPSLEKDPALWEWESLLDFDKIGYHECTLDSDVGQICPEIWDIVARELGIITEEEEEAAEPDPVPEPAAEPSSNSEGQSGCLIQDHRPAGIWLIALMMFLLITVSGLRRKGEDSL